MYDLPPSLFVSEFTEATSYLFTRYPAITGTYAEAQRQLGHRGWTVAGVSDMQLCQDVLNAVTMAETNGLTLDEFKKDFQGRLEAAWGKADSFRVETVYLTNTASAYNRGKWLQSQDRTIKEMFPWAEFFAVDDSRTSTICRERSGWLVRVDSPQYLENQCPLHHRCRSTWEFLSQNDYEQLPEEQRSRAVPMELPAKGFGGLPEEWRPDLGKYDGEMVEAWKEKDEARKLVAKRQISEGLLSSSSTWAKAEVKSLISKGVELGDVKKLKKADPKSLKKATKKFAVPKDVEAVVLEQPTVTAILDTEGKLYITDGVEQWDAAANVGSKLQKVKLKKVDENLETEWVADGLLPVVERRLQKSMLPTVPYPEQVPLTGGFMNESARLLKKLTKEEREAIQEYASDDYTETRSTMLLSKEKWVERYGKAGYENCYERAKTIAAAISKCKSKNLPKTIYRGMSLSSRELEEGVINSQFFFQEAITSTSRNVASAQRFAGGEHPVMFVLHLYETSGIVPVETMVSFSSEREMLLGGRRLFRVVSVGKTEKKAATRVSGEDMLVVTVEQIPWNEDLRAGALHLEGELIAFS